MYKKAEAVNKKGNCEKHSNARRHILPDFKFQNYNDHDSEVAMKAQPAAAEESNHTQVFPSCQVALVSPSCQALICDPCTLSFNRHFMVTEITRVTVE